MSASPKTTVRVHLTPNIDLEKINTIVSTIGGRSGCRTCGLLGMDLQLVGDPGDLSAVEKLPGVAAVDRQ